MVGKEPTVATPVINNGRMLEAILAEIRPLRLAAEKWRIRPGRWLVVISGDKLGIAIKYGGRSALLPLAMPMNVSIQVNLQGIEPGGGHEQLSGGGDLAAVWGKILPASP